jgi:hypothetical protein
MARILTKDTVIHETERESVHAWRRQALEEIGFDMILADSLAARMDVDVHKLEAMVKAGCSIALAEAIIA